MPILAANVAFFDARLLYAPTTRLKGRVPAQANTEAGGMSPLHLRTEKFAGVSTFFGPGPLR